MKTCSCFDLDYPVYNNSYNSCLDSVILQECRKNASISTENSDDFKNDCEAACPFECNRIDYEYNIAGNEVTIFKLVRKNIF